MLSTAEIFFLLLFVLLLGVAIYLFYRTYRYGNELKAKPLVRGLNGTGGDTITLQCPSGQVISINQATYVCTGGENTTGDSCDPILTQGPTVNSSNYGSFNPATTVSAVSQLAAACNGKQTATFTVPSVGDAVVATMCNGQPCGNGGTIQLIGTYYCQAPSS